MLRQKLFKFLLRDWQYEVSDGVLDDPKKVIIGFPHTSPLDGIWAVIFSTLLQLDHHVLVKRELFWFPLGILLKRLGCIPVDRRHSTHIVQQMVEEFAQRETFTLIISPEGTRKGTIDQHPIHSGFWHIAKEARVPIVLMFSDSRRRTARVFAKLMPSDSIESDLHKIQVLYATYGIHVELPISSKSMI